MEDLGLKGGGRPGGSNLTVHRPRGPGGREAGGGPRGIGQLYRVVDGLAIRLFCAAASRSGCPLGSRSDSRVNGAPNASSIGATMRSSRFCTAGNENNGAP